MSSFSPGQCRAARGILDLSQAELSAKSKVAPKTIADFERGKRVPFANNLTAIRVALETEGVIFVDENGSEGPGVRLKKRPLAVAEITEKIEVLDQKIADMKVEGPRSPETGMNQLEKALVQNERTKLKNRRTKIRRPPA
jgi:transcriptional regulator with XRE-family HTH domain